MKPITLADFGSYKFISGLTYSPDGSHVALVCANASIKDNGYRRFIYVADAKTLKFKKLTNGGGEGSICWLDNNTLVFPRVSENDDKEALKTGEELSVLYSIDINGGEAEELFRVPLVVTSILNIDGENLVLNVKTDLSRPKLEGLKPDERKKALAQYMAEKRDFTVADELPFRFNGMGTINKLRNAVFTYNLKTKIYTKVTSENFHTSTAKLSNDKKSIIISGREFDKLNYLRRDGIFKYCLEAKTFETVLNEGVYDLQGFELLDENVIFIGSKPKDGFDTTYPDIFRITSNGEAELYMDLSQYDFNFGCSVGTDCRLGMGRSFQVLGDVLYFVGTINNTAQLFSLKDKVITQITNSEITVDSFDICETGAVATGMTDVTLGEVYALNISDGKLTKKSSFNTKSLSGYYVANSNPVSVTNKEGYRIDGFVLEPINYDESKTYPAILEIHGGPHTSYGPVFYHEMQAMASAECFVFFCNPRGSTGRGRDFFEIAGKWGDIDYKDIMTFTDAVLEKYPQIDKDRLGVTGGSYGGYMTNWIIGQTDRFKGAVAQRSISEWGHFNLVGDIPGTGLREIQADLWTDIERVYNQSPLKYVKNAKTPTMFIHSFEDFRCTQPEAEQMYRALLDNGVDTRICFFKGENHELSRSGKPKHRIRRLKEITEWLYKYIKA